LDEVQHDNDVAVAPVMRDERACAARSSCGSSSIGTSPLLVPQSRL